MSKKEYSRADSAGSGDSGFGGSTSGSVTDLSSVGDPETIKQVKMVIGLLEEDFNRSKAFVSTRLADLAAADGVVHMDTQSFVEMKKLFLESAGDFSVAATFAGMDKKVKEVLEQTAEADMEDVEKLFAKFEGRKGLFRQEMEKSLSSPEGAEHLLSEYHCKQLFFQSFPLFNVDSDGNPKPISTEKRKEIGNKIIPLINPFPSELIRGLSLGGVGTKSDITTKLINEFKKAMIDEFAVDPTKAKFPILSREKMTADHIEEFADKLNNFVAKLDTKALTTEVEKRLEENERKAITSDLLKDVITSVENKQKFPVDQQDKVTKILSAALEKMDSKYLRDNKDALITKLENSVVASRTFASKFVKGKVVVPGQQIEDLSKRMIGEYEKWREQERLAAESKLSQETVQNIQLDPPPPAQPPIMRQEESTAMPDVVAIPELKPADKAYYRSYSRADSMESSDSGYSGSSASSSVSDLTGIGENQEVPAKINRIVAAAIPELKSADKADSQPVELTDVLIEIKEDVAPIVEHSIKLVPDQSDIWASVLIEPDPEYYKNGENISRNAINEALIDRKAKITPEQHKKISDFLESALAKHDPECLKDHEVSITKELAIALATQGKVSFWRSRLTIDPEKLSNIAKVQEEKIIQWSEDAILKKLSFHQMGNTVLAERLSEFIQKNKAENIDLPPDLKKTTNRQLVKMQNSNRILFDETIFPESKVSREGGGTFTPSKTPFARTSQQTTTR